MIIAELARSIKIAEKMAEKGPGATCTSQAARPALSPSCGSKMGAGQQADQVKNPGAFRMKERAS